MDFVCHGMSLSVGTEKVCLDIAVASQRTSIDASAGQVAVIAPAVFQKDASVNFASAAFFFCKISRSV